MLVTNIVWTKGSEHTQCTFPVFLKEKNKTVNLDVHMSWTSIDHQFLYPYWKITYISHMRMWVLCDQLWKTCEGAFHHAMSCKHMGICNCMKHFTHQNKLIMWNHMWKEIKPQGLYVKSPHVKKCVKHNILRKCLYTTCEIYMWIMFFFFFIEIFLQCFLNNFTDSLFHKERLYMTKTLADKVI